MTTTQTRCPDCGAALALNAPGGLCAQCLLRLGLGEELSWERDGALARLDPDLAPRLLASLDQSIGPFPRISLRDGPADESRPVGPGSAEVFDHNGDAGRYQLLGEIARGGFGAILKGRDAELGRDLAVKVLLEKHRDRPDMIRRFVEEAQISGQLQHPGIVPVHELGRFPDGRLYIAMKLVQGRTLAALLEARAEPNEDRGRFLGIFAQVCQTVAYAHARGVIHRDLKPSNVMVGSFGEVQVMDWGLAKVLTEGGVTEHEPAQRAEDESSPGSIRTWRSGSDTGASRTGSVLGTPAYMAPEQARGALDTLDERADVFGLGSILCEVLTGRPAYAGSSSDEVYHKAASADLADALARLGACRADGELVALARSCLAPAARDRPRDAVVVAAGLTAYLASADQRLRTAELARAQADVRAASERKRRVLTVALALSVLATALLGAGGWAWMSHDRAERAVQTADKVQRILAEAARYRDAARKAPVRDAPPLWEKARSTALGAAALAEQGESEALRDQVKAFLAALHEEAVDAEETRRDRGAVETLVRLLDDQGFHEDVQTADAFCAALFRGYGVDVAPLEPAAAARAAGGWRAAWFFPPRSREAPGGATQGARIAASPVAADLVYALDLWAALRRGPELHDPIGAQRITAIARAADPERPRDPARASWILDSPGGWRGFNLDPSRNRLRDALEARDRAGAVDTLGELAGTASLPFVNRMPRLAFALALLGEREQALALLRRVQLALPDDFGINCALGQELMAQGRPEEAVRFYAAAIVARPLNGLARNGLGTALHQTGKLEDAEATFKQVFYAGTNRSTLDGPACATAHINLGALALDQDDPRRAKDEFLRAKQKSRQARDWWPSCDIAQVYLSRGEWTAALAEIGEDLKIEPANARALGRGAARDGLDARGGGLARQGRPARPGPRPDVREPGPGASGERRV